MEGIGRADSGLPPRVYGKDAVRGKENKVGWARCWLLRLGEGKKEKIKSQKGKGEEEEGRGGRETQIYLSFFSTTSHVH